MNYFGFICLMCIANPILWSQNWYAWSSHIQCHKHATQFECQSLSVTVLSSDSRQFKGNQKVKVEIIDVNGTIEVVFLQEDVGHGCLEVVISHDWFGKEIVCHKCCEKNEMKRFFENLVEIFNLNKEPIASILDMVHSPFATSLVAPVAHLCLYMKDNRHYILRRR